MKTIRRIIVYFMVSGPLVLQAQELMLETCYEKAGDLSSLKKKETYYKTLSELEEKNAATGYLPQLTLKGMAAYQSDVFEFPLNLPGADMPAIPKDQYSVMLSIRQNIYDGGITARSREVTKSQYQVNQAQVDVEMYKIREIINNLYFSALIMQAREDIQEAVLEDLRENLKVIDSGVENGLLLPAAKYGLEKMILKAEQQLMEARMQKEILREMLAEWIGEEIDPDTEFVLPGIEPVASKPAIERPEIFMFETRQQLLETRKDILKAQNRPVLFLFADAGVGSPNIYNWFETDISPFYKVGVGLQWKIWDWDQSGRKIETSAINQQIIQAEREHFEKQVSVNTRNFIQEIEKYDRLIEKDREIIEIQEKIVKQAFARFESGVISSAEYLSEVNQQTQARVSLRMHEIQRAKAYVEFLTLSGNHE